MDQNEGEVNKKGEKKNQQGQYPVACVAAGPRTRLNPLYSPSAN